MVRLVTLLTLFTLGLRLGFAQDIFIAEKRSVPHSFFLEGGINSRAEENCPLWTFDGKGLFFVRQDPLGIAGYDIFRTRKINDTLWALPEKLGKPLNNKGDNAVVAVTDSQGLFLLNAYLSSRNLLPGLSFVNYDSLGWTKPKPLDLPDFKPMAGAPIGFAKGPGFMLISYKDSSESKHHIYWSKSKRTDDSSWSSPIKIEGWPNHKGSSYAPSLSFDGKRLFFSTSDLPGFGGSDIYFSERLDSTGLKWSEPKNMGPAVNTVGFEAYWAQHPKNRFAVFTSDGGRIASQTDLLAVDTSVLQSALKLNEVEAFKNQQVANKHDANQSKLNLKNDGETPNEAPETLDDQAYAFPKDLSQFEERFTWSVYFAFDSDSVVKKYDRRIKDAFKEWERDTTQLILIEGHTDSTGSRSYALNLSARRANAVLSKLKLLGVSESKCAVEAHGMKYPKRKETTEKARSLNRRADIILLRKSIYEQ